MVGLDAKNMNLRKDAIREAFDGGDWGTARRLLEDGLANLPADAELLALSGSALLQAQRYDDAEQALSSALAQGLDDPALHYNLAFAQFMQARYIDALERLYEPQVVQAVRIALLLRARCLHHLQRAEEGIPDCEAFLAESPDDAAARGLLALLLYEVHRHDESLLQAKAALHRDPEQLEALLALASMQSDSRDDAAARESYTALLKAHPQCGRGWLGLGLVKFRHMQFDAAQQDIQQAALHMPDHIGSWHLLAWMAIMAGDVDGAGTAFEQALTLDRSFGETHGGLAAIAALQGQEEDARASIQRALRLDRQCASARYAEMLLLQRNGQHEQAQAVLEAFLSSPVARSDMQYRDLVALQMGKLGAAA